MTMSFTLWEQSELADYAANAELDIMGLTRQLESANARIAELEAQLDSKVDALMHNMVLRERVATLEAQLSKPATIHEVIDDFGTTVTAVTL